MQESAENLYFVDPENSAEMARLILQGELLTRGMKGVFTPQEREIIEEKNYTRILDLACGPGEWCLAVAREYPDREVVGVDISETMIRYATARALSQNIQNVSFEVADIAKPFSYSDGSFDLVNGRTFALFEKKDWPLFLGECLRLTRPGGAIRLTESEWGFTNSLAYDTICWHLALALHKMGQTFSPTGRINGITGMLDSLIRDAGYVDRRLTSHVINVSFGTDSYLTFREDSRALFYVIQPFIVGVGAATQEQLDAMADAYIREISAEDFSGVMFLLTAWGHKPE
ncbi:MAG TPA: methyltransferase domain-containing protein [Ktedonobacteraceae bacterium]|nr:methyltransferase domain-containing protein [Ktedonobacteraceae bacterium]